MMYKFWTTLLVSVIFFSSNAVYGVKNECSSNPCTGKCEICVVNTNIRCIKAPCPQYECQRNETCFNNSTNIPKLKDECASNPCTGACENCVPSPKVCKKAPCPQYECRRNESCINKSQDDPVIIVDECASNPCHGECEICVPNPHIRCFRAPCPQYECKTNESCYISNPTDDVPKNEACTLPVDPGNCLAYVPMWFFNVTSKQCEKFVYGGCGGNDNKFSTNLHCDRVCILGRECPMVKLPPPKKGCRYDKSPREDGCPSNNLVCDVKAGSCPIISNKTSTDTCMSECSTDKNCDEDMKCCKIGCNNLCLSPDTRNNNSSSEESASHETGDRTSLPKSKICLLPKEDGMCEMFNPKYYFNSETMECEKFSYGGCGGNANKFSTEDECERICLSGQECPKLRHISAPDGCRFTEEKGEDGCPMKQMICDVKPGECPHVVVNMSSDACTTECAHDSDCPHEKKCCNVECNSLCLDPKKKIKQNPGQCPVVTPSKEPSFGICANICSNDEDCKSEEKCCSNECGGTTCVKPLRPPLPVCKQFCMQGTECKLLDGKPQCVNRTNCIFKPLPMPSIGCHYNAETGSDGCPEYKLVCNRSVDPCASNPCKPDERCAVLECFVAPCTAVQCLPIRVIPECENNKCLPCETCVRTPLMCLRAPCQQYTCQNACEECSTCGKNGTCERFQTQQTSSCSNKTCENRRCQKYPDAKCVVDKCNCDRHFFISSKNEVITNGECESI